MQLNHDDTVLKIKLEKAYTHIHIHYILDLYKQDDQLETNVA